MKAFLSVWEAAEKWKVSERRIHQYCAEGRIPGAQKLGKSWAIPGRRKSRRIRTLNKNTVVFSQDRSLLYPSDSEQSDPEALESEVSIRDNQPSSPSVLQVHRLQEQMNNWSRELDDHVKQFQLALNVTLSSSNSEPHVLSVFRSLSALLEDWDA